jgi:hypothetical protein
MIEVVQAFDRTPIVRFDSDDAAALDRKIEAARRLFADGGAWLKTHQRIDPRRIGPHNAVRASARNSTTAATITATRRRGSQSSQDSSRQSERYNPRCQWSHDCRFDKYQLHAAGPDHRPVGKYSEALSTFTVSQLWSVCCLSNVTVYDDMSQIKPATLPAT